jgi:hypothetical protein
MPFGELKKLLLEVFEGLKGFGVEVLDFEEEVDRRIQAMAPPEVHIDPEVRDAG